MLDQYQDKVKIVYKNFPLPNHPYAKKAALAALAADDQGKFWEVHDALFENYSKLNDQKIRDIVMEIGLDMEHFDDSLANPRTEALIERDLKEASAIEVRATPTIFINGRLLGNRTLNGFQQIIDPLLEKGTAPNQKGEKP